MAAHAARRRPAPLSRHVTVGLDGSLQSDAAAEWAAREAVLREVPLRLVHADEWPVWTADPEAEAGVQRPGVQRLWADKLLAEAAERLRQRHPSLEISTRRLSGRPSTALATEAADADLLVLGSRGLSCVMGFVLGSVGMETITAAEGPVVFVRAPAFPGADQDTRPDPRATWSSASTSTSPATRCSASPSTRPHAAAAACGRSTAGHSRRSSTTRSRSKQPSGTWHRTSPAASGTRWRLGSESTLRWQSSS